jgi:hypothetical protein
MPEVISVVDSDSDSDIDEQDVIIVRTPAKLIGESPCGGGEWNCFSD